MKDKIKIGLLWPFQSIVVESLFRHYTGLAEPAGYLNDKSLLFSKYEMSLEIYDCAVKRYSAKQFAQIVYDSDILFLCVNMNNITDALECAQFIKSLDDEMKVIAYGEGVCCRPQFFANKPYFDFVIDSGEYELCMEIALTSIFGLDTKYLHPVLRADNAYSIKNKIIYIESKIALPTDDWGIPLISKLPLKEYKEIGDNELHITVCKGCPYSCEFCNERHVNGKNLQYRNIEQLIGFMEEYKNDFASVYLDASTFSYSKTWVLKFCEGLKRKGHILPWKTCTRLDCLDEELIVQMASANCTRISIGIETLNHNTQKKNNKIIDIEKLVYLKHICDKHNVKMRLLLIIGLDEQRLEDIDKTIEFFNEYGFELRFRIYQNFDFLLVDEICEINEQKLKEINRITYPSMLPREYANKFRQLEYPREINLI